uniref:Uncharacterized protein n=1 Tax=Anguilla anguilla TaxID=7936 RepID=A0A0E9S3X6_ANGAN
MNLEFTSHKLAFCSKANHREQTQRLRGEALVHYKHVHMTVNAFLDQPVDGEEGRGVFPHPCVCYENGNCLLI